MLIRHNLDVMHIEKNICEAFLGTLLEIAGKTKDTEKARLDLQDTGIRKVLTQISVNTREHSNVRVANGPKSGKATRTG